MRLLVMMCKLVWNVCAAPIIALSPLSARDDYDLCRCILLSVRLLLSQKKRDLKGLWSSPSASVSQRLANDFLCILQPVKCNRVTSRSPAWVAIAIGGSRLILAHYWRDGYFSTTKHKSCEWIGIMVSSTKPFFFYIWFPFCLFQPNKWEVLTIYAHESKYHQKHFHVLWSCWDNYRIVFHICKDAILIYDLSLYIHINNKKKDKYREFQTASASYMTQSRWLNHLLLLIHVNAVCSREHYCHLVEGVGRA